MSSTPPENSHDDTYNRWLGVAIHELPVPIYMADPKTGRYTYGNAAMEKMLGVPFPIDQNVDIQKQKMIALECGTRRVVTFDEFPSSRAARGEVVKDQEFIWKTFNGEYEVSVTANVVQPAGEIDGTILLVVKDISALKLAQKRLEESESRLQLAVASAEMGTWHIDLKTRHLTSSETTASIFGYPAAHGNVDDEIGKKMHPDDRDEVNRAWQTAVTTGEPYYHEYRIVRPDGEIRWVASQGKTRFDNAGNPEAFSGVISDITQRKKIRPRT